jgi:hypothetical protein
MRMDPRIDRKKEKEGIRLQIFRFFGGWVWSEGKKKGSHRRIVSDRHGYPLVIFKICVVGVRTKDQEGNRSVNVGAS